VTFCPDVEIKSSRQIFPGGTEISSALNPGALRYLGLSDCLDHMSQKLAANGSDTQPVSRCPKLSDIFASYNDPQGE
jgi:hypothetical protein